MKVDSEKVGDRVGCVGVRHCGSYDVIVIDQGWTAGASINGRDMRGDHLAVSRAFAVTLREACIGEMNVVTVVWKARGITCFGDIWPVERNSGEAF